MVFKLIACFINKSARENIVSSGYGKLAISCHYQLTCDRNKNCLKLDDCVTLSWTWCKWRLFVFNREFVEQLRFSRGMGKKIFLFVFKFLWKRELVRGNQRTDEQTVKHNHFEFELNFGYDNFWVISKLACREALFLCVLQSKGGRHEAALGASQARESRSPEACLRSPVKHEKITPVRQANLKTSFFCRERCFSSCHERVSLHEESNLRAPILYHWATETLLWARFITKSRWNASCILLRSAVSTVSFL